MPISGQGWELLIKRIGLHRRGQSLRTYGSYQAYSDGVPIPGLAGYICEPVGPGDNSPAGKGKKRIAAGRYPLWTQFGRYVSTGYSTNSSIAGQEPMPGILLRGTGARTAILIHPAHPPNLFLSSIGCLNPSEALLPTSPMNFWDSRKRVIAILDSLRAHHPDAFAHATSTRIRTAFVVVEGEPEHELEALSATSLFMPLSVAAGAAPVLPISKSGALACARWLNDNFGEEMRKAVEGKAYGVKHLCAIVCQETAYKWLKWIGVKPVEEIVGRAVFDASGDYPGTSRGAFPLNTAAFRAAYGKSFTDMLIEEANMTRRLQGYGDKPWVYKGYGLFQYDLQHIKTDEAFFRDKQWYSFSACLAKCTQELDAKLKAKKGNLWAAIKAYNGSGPKAEAYMQNVKVFTPWCAEVVG